MAKTTQKAQIRFSTQIIKRLGEELNPSIDQSILELVKNSYDANARNCVVDLINIGRKGGSIRITDDGDGLTDKEIVDGFLILGESQKLRGKKTRIGRIPAGSKGLGRLAAIRSGTQCRLESVSIKKPKSRNDLKINWKKYDNARLVEDVFLPITKTSLASSVAPGTVITISKLKDKYSERDIRKVARGLILLADPFEDDPQAFKPILRTEEFSQLEKLVSKRYFDDADFHLKAEVNQKGIASATIRDYRGNVLYRASHGEITKKRKSYKCPATTFDLWAFLLTQTSFQSRRTSLTEVREWLKEFGGVHLYENRLRVNPYGNPGNDWLDMNLARAKSPEERPSTNTSIGVVRVKDPQSLLVQKTDRSGFIETDDFQQIREFCQDTLEWMAKKRLQEAEKKRSRTRTGAAKKSSRSRDSVYKYIQSLSPAKRRQLQKAFEKFEKSQQEEIKVLKSEVQLYRTLSTAGITAATFSHESSGNAIKVITQSIKAIERRAKRQFTAVEYERNFAEPIGVVYTSLNTLSVLGTAVLTMITHEKRRVTRVEIHTLINRILETFRPFFIGRDIEVTSELEHSNPFLRATEAAVESILTNLLNNSIATLEKKTEGKRFINVKTSVEQDIVTITVADNGRGIQGIDLKDIWLPGQTTNPNGTGLGLTIVRDAVTDLGGNVSAVAKGHLGGAELLIEIPIIGK